MQTVGLGIIGCGGFGLFALQHFTQVPGVTLRGMAGTHRAAAEAAARRFGVNEIERVEKLVDNVYQMLELSCGHDLHKLYRYGELLRAMLEDQVAWIQDRDHQRRVTGQNGRDSLALAVAADRLAHSDSAHAQTTL